MSCATKAPKGRPRFRVTDWAGNDLTPHYGLFASFEDAWGAVYAYLETQNLSEADFEECCGEYYVLEVEG